MRRVAFLFLHMQLLSYRDASAVTLLTDGLLVWRFCPEGLPTYLPPEPEEPFPPQAYSRSWAPTRIQIGASEA